MISVIIPCYNEEKRIGKTLEKIKRYLDKKKLENEIIVVDDASTDGTINVAKRFDCRIIRNNRNSGKGFSVKNGVLHSKGDLFLFTDADLSTPIEELDLFLKLIKEYDIVIGSRRTKDAKVEIKQKNFRYIAGHAFPLLVQLFILAGIKDSQCGFKLFRKKCKKIFRNQTINGFAFDVELLYLASRYNLKVKEQGVRWLNDENSKVNVIKHSFIMLLEVLKIRLNSFFGKYD